MTPGHCRGKAHKAEHLGYAGRRVLVSRKWSDKTLRDHKANRRAWVLDALGLPDDTVTDPHRYAWRPVSSKDPTRTPLPVRLLRGVANRPPHPRPRPPRRTTGQSRRQAHPRTFGSRRGGLTWNPCSTGPRTPPRCSA